MRLRQAFDNDVELTPKAHDAFYEVLYSKAFPSGPGAPIIAQPLIRQKCHRGQSSKDCRQIYPWLEESFWQQAGTVGCAMNASVYYERSMSNLSVTRRLSDHDARWPICTEPQAHDLPCYRNKAWHRACEEIPCDSKGGGGLARSSILAAEVHFVEQQMYSIDAAFLKHLLTRVIEPSLFMFETDWGVDPMWCAVAHAYGRHWARLGSKTRPACVLVPAAVAIHHNTRTIAKFDEDFRLAGRLILKHYRLKYPQFFSWSPCTKVRMQVLGVVSKMPQSPAQERKRVMRMRAETWKACTRHFMQDPPLETWIRRRYQPATGMMQYFVSAPHAISRS